MTRQDHEPVYYFAETTSLYSFRKAEPLKACSLTSAKREARRKSIYYGTWLKIGTSINSEGLLTSFIAYYSPEDSRWHERSCDYE